MGAVAPPSPPRQPAEGARADLIAGDIDAYLARHRRKTLLRFITCGSVDDGKSTLIGRLLFECDTITEDQLAALRADSRRMGTQRQAIDFALLVDGLTAEREQGITIDVGYRYFTTDKRQFIVADTPGHEQYTRNMVTGASNADLAVILIDARKGVLTQTRRHGFLADLIGIRDFVVAVNKMDLIDHDQARYGGIVADFRAYAASIGIEDFTAIPVSGLKGDNVTTRSANMPWYAGPTLIDHLETVSVDQLSDAGKPFRMAVQWVNRPDPDFRGVAGLVSAGTVTPGATVRVMPSGRVTTVARIVTADGDLPMAVAGQSVTLTFADDVDCSRGDVVANADRPPLVADRFAATLVWMADEAMVPGRPYWLKLGTRTVTARVHAPDYEISIDPLERRAAGTLALNAIGVARLSTDRPLVFDAYADGRTLGGFILIDRNSNATVAAGMINAPPHDRQVAWQATEVSRARRAAMKNQKAAVLWLTGLSGAGKTTIANLIERKLAGMNRHCFLLDGDNVRHGLSRDLGFTDADRAENVRRVGEVARLMTDAGLIVIAALISPFRAERDTVRAMMAPGEFIEVHIDTPLAVAEARDVKGLYAQARAGRLRNFTGIDSPYEPPETPEIRINTTALSAEEAADAIVALLESIDRQGADGS